MCYNYLSYLFLAFCKIVVLKLKCLLKKLKSIYKSDDDNTAYNTSLRKKN